MEIKNFEDLGEYLFVSETDNNGKKKVGSIYFRNGRIRLVHKNGPEVSAHDSDTYFIRYNEGKTKLKLCFGTSKDDRAILKDNFENVVSTQIPQYGRLYEEFTNNGKNYKHPSRGIPQFLEIDNAILKNIYEIVSKYEKQSDKSKANIFVYDEVAKLNLDFGIYEPKDCNNS